MKKYRFDYLIVEVSEESMDYRVVIYIDDFEITPTNKTDLVEIIPINVNSEKVIAAKVERIAAIYLKVNKFEINNFISNKFFKLN